VFYTYAHYTPDGNLFYIGKGNGKRAHTFYDRNKRWKDIVSAHGLPKVQILANWDAEEDALDHEKLLISCFRDMGYTLANLTDGGEGFSGYKLTAEQIQKMRLSKIGKPTWNKGIPMSVEAKQKLSIARKGNKSALGHKVTAEARKLMGIKNIGRPASAHQRKRASETHKGNKYAVGNTSRRAWKWIGTNLSDGSVVEFYGSHALNAAGFQHANVIKCINGTRKSHKGFTWTKEPLKELL